MANPRLRKIAVVTGGRADYGLLLWLMREIDRDPQLELQVIATGSHLSPEFGLTYRFIEADGLRIAAKVEMLLSSDSLYGVTKATGLGVIGFADCFCNLEPDIVVVLGDRFEILAAAQAAMLCKIPLAHIHGGEVTEGAIDESIRHAITKMAQLHFVAADEYRRRVIQMGEQPGRVFTVGAPGLDALTRLPLFDRSELERSLEFEIGNNAVLVTYHPATLSSVGPEVAMRALFDALDCFPSIKVIFTKSNADACGRIIGSMIDEYVSDRRDRMRSFVTLGQQRYLSAMKVVKAVVGNSSSGIIEAPAFGVPTVNIGERQSGRLKAASVIDCGNNVDEIILALEEAFDSEFKAKVSEQALPYGAGGAAEKIVQVLKESELKGLCIKIFNDVSG